MIFPETQAKIPKVKAIIAEVPAASPSMPSVKLAPLDTEVMINTTANTNTIQTYFSKPG